MKVFGKTDLRVSLLLALVNAIAVMVIKQELCFITLLGIACLWMCLRGSVAKSLKFLLGYLILSALAYLTMDINGLQTLWLMLNLMRHLLIPIAYADGLSDAPTGTLLFVFHKLHLPKAFGISTVVLLRFIPTIYYELRAIRNSLKFRNVGTGFWSTVAHLPDNFEKTMVPLLIRTTRIAEELSAAAMVRGVRLNNEIVSYDAVSFKRGDAAVSIVFFIMIVLVCIADAFVVLRVTL